MDYYNDFQRMVRSDNIETVIEQHREWRGRDCRTDEQIQSRADVTAVLDATYASRPGSHAALIRLASICSALTPTEFDLLIHILRGGNFSQYASCAGVTGAAVGQRWSKVVSRSPLLAEVKR